MALRDAEKQRRYGKRHIEVAGTKPRVGFFSSAHAKAQLVLFAASALLVLLGSPIRASERVPFYSSHGSTSGPFYSQLATRCQLYADSLLSGPFHHDPAALFSFAANEYTSHYDNWSAAVRTAAISRFISSFQHNLSSYTDNRPRGQVLSVPTILSEVLITFVGSDYLGFMTPLVDRLVDTSVLKILPQQTYDISTTAGILASVGDIARLRQLLHTVKGSDDRETVLSEGARYLDAHNFEKLLDDEHIPITSISADLRIIVALSAARSAITNNDFNKAIGRALTLENRSLSDNFTKSDLMFDIFQKMLPSNKSAAYQVLQNIDEISSFKSAALAMFAASEKSQARFQEAKRLIETTGSMAGDDTRYGRLAQFLAEAGFFTDAITTSERLSVARREEYKRALVFTYGGQLPSTFVNSFLRESETSANRLVRISTLAFRGNFSKISDTRPSSISKESDNASVVIGSVFGSQIDKARQYFSGERDARTRIDALIELGVVASLRGQTGEAGRVVSSLDSKAKVRFESFLEFTKATFGEAADCKTMAGYDNNDNLGREVLTQYGYLSKNKRFLFW
jgi:hypothetical protein